MVAALGLGLLALAGCKKLDTQHNTVTDESLNKNLFQVISSDSKYMTFTKLLVQTGYDKVLSSTKTYTVFALNETVVKTIDPVVLMSSTKLKTFIANHITEQSLPISVNTPTARIQMIGGKYNLLSSSKIESSSFVASNRYAANGLIHDVSAPLYAMDNCWEFLYENPAAPTNHKFFLRSLFRNVFDLTNAKIIGVDPNTGANLYQPGTDSVYANLYLKNVYDLRDESKQYTLFLLSDAGLTSEVGAYASYFPTTTPDSTSFAATWNVVRDYAIDGAYAPNQLPDTLVSKFGAKVPVNKANIVSSYKTSNGYVYVMSALPVAPKQRFATKVIEAENYVASSVDRRSYTYFRDRYNDSTFTKYSDVLVLNHGVAMFNLRYDLQEMPMIKYKAYWIAVNDFQTAAYQQKLGVGSPASTLLPYTNVNGSATTAKKEIYLGEFQLARYYPILNLYLTAANSTTSAANPLVCDYIKLVPSL